MRSLKSTILPWKVRRCPSDHDIGRFFLGKLIRAWVAGNHGLSTVDYPPCFCDRRVSLAIVSIVFVFSLPHIIAVISALDSYPHQFSVRVEYNQPARKGKYPFFLI